jgi:hypothetical protein
MGFGNAIQKRMDELRKKGTNVPEIIKRVQKDATIRAVETAKEMTPPNNENADSNAVGEMKSKWDEDSITAPEVIGSDYTTTLANSVGYASYVNDGHRMDMHFVPGLEIADGILLKTGREGVGIMVGTKTKYVPGKYMKETAVARWRGTVERELDREIKELFKE